ncbi:MAG: PASTA domain-containing protein [Clostridia bacterium]|nr:PASTA domain-containing protein [Clostridia bacterium]
MTKEKNRKITKRGTFLLFFFIFLAIIITITLFKIQILGYDDFQKNVIEQLTVETNVNPLRGKIYDRNGVTLASNKTVWVLYLVPKKISNPEFIAKEISNILECDYDSVLNKAKKTGYKYQVIDIDLNEEQAKKIREFIDKYSLTDQIQLNASSERYYPLSSLASHTLGFVNADGVGIYGLEKVYNNILEGTSGKYITAQDAQSSDMPFQYETYIESENGYNLVSTIDTYIQYQLELQLETAAIESGAQNRAAGIVMNPKTGEIYAMAVYPDFNLNEPYVLDELSQAKLDEYQKDTKEYRNAYLNLLYTMWNNKAVTELYEPGSTFKLVTTSVALETKAASLANRYICTGSLKIDGYYRAISCHKRKGHGNLTFAEALQQSCNPSMMKLAFSIGKEKFYDYFQKFGYTSKTGIDLPSEASGYYHSYDDFSNVSLAVYSFGQTFKTTAIQQLRAVSVVANGGYLVEPHLIKSIVDNEGNTVYEYETEKSEQIIDADVCKTISQILKEGVDGEGGAKNAYVAGYSIAAKTGTSEKKDKYDENGQTSYRVSSCVAYGPSEDAEVAVIILVDEPTVGSKYGSVVAAPYVGNLMEDILPYLGIEAVYNENDIEHIEIEIPDVINKSLGEAEIQLKDAGIAYEIIGEGEEVISQMPIGGTKIYKKSGKVLIYTGQDLETHTYIPNVVGKTAEQANLILTNSRLNIEIDGATNFVFGKSAIVTEQYPIAGTSVPIGTVVKIKIMFTDEED